MPLIKELKKAARKAAPIVAMGAGGGLIGLGLYAGHKVLSSQKKAKRGAEQLAQQEMAAIQEQRNRIESERNRMSSEREASSRKVTMGRRAANRRRVRGGLFGDSTVDQNVQARLG